MDVDRQLKKGVLAIIVLKMFTKQDMYGYELMQTLDINSNGYYKLKEGSLYPVLYRLEDNKLIESYWKTIEGNKSVPRKYYSITKEGKKEIKMLTEKWENFTSISNKLILEEKNEKL